MRGGKGGCTGEEEANLPQRPEMGSAASVESGYTNWEWKLNKAAVPTVPLSPMKYLSNPDPRDNPGKETSCW